MVAPNDDHGESRNYSRPNRRFEVGLHSSPFLLSHSSSPRFELRLRYFPQTLDTLTQNKSILSFFYEQLRIDYMRCKSENVPMNIAIELGSLEIRKLFKDLNSTALDKKVNIDYLEKELGLRTFFPQSLIDSQKVSVYN